MNGEFLRGEVYWSRMDNGWGSEEAAKRPVVIISNDKGNASCPTVMCAFMTSKFKYGSINVETYSTGQRSWIMGNQLRTLDKSRLIEYITMLTDEELAELNDALVLAMDLNPEDDNSEIERLEGELTAKDDEIAKLRAEIADFEKHKERLIAENTVNNDIWKRMYDVALSELVALKISKDVEKAIAVTETSPIEEAAPPKIEAAPKVEETKPEINTCSEDDLRKVGCSPLMVHYIIKNRPYKSVDDLRRVSQVTNVGFKLLEKKVCCIPVIAPKPPKEPKPAELPKVNINTASREDFSVIEGFSDKTAYSIVRYRSKNGLFEKVEDLLKVPRFGSYCLKKYGPRLEV